MYPPGMTYPTGQTYGQDPLWKTYPRGGYEHNEESPSPLTRWIEEFQFPDGLKVPPHVGYYDGKGDPDLFIHVFEEAMRMEKWAMSVTCHMFVYILKDAARVWWNSLPKGVVVNYEDLKKRFRTHFKQHKTNQDSPSSQRYKKERGAKCLSFYNLFISTELPKSYDRLMERVYSWLQAKVTASEGRPITFMDSSTGEKAQKGRPWEGTGKKNRERRDRELKNQIEEAFKSRKLAHLIKRIRKGKAKQTDNQLGEWVTPAVKMEPITDGKEEPILMIGVINNPLKRKESPKIMSIEEMIFPPIRNRAPSVDHILISVQVYGRQVETRESATEDKYKSTSIVF
ncbi:hypothetical protein Tco_0016023 [Tanacetum coccineum]